MDWIGLDWATYSRYFNVILIVIALSDCQCVQIFRLSFDVNCCITNLLLSLLVVIHVVDCMHHYKMLNRFLYTRKIVFATGSLSLMDWIGLDLAKWTHVQLCGSSPVLSEMSSS